MPTRNGNNGRPRDPKQRTVAVIDIGSNSWRVDVYTYVPQQWWKCTDEVYETVRIAAGLAKSGRLSEDALERGIETLDVFGRFCKASGLTSKDIEAVATSAVRDAANGDQLIGNSLRRFGFEISILPAEDEAYYGYLAAVNSTTLTDGAVMDIGGGSVQLIGVKERRRRNWGSWPLGAIRVTERLLADGKPKRPSQLNDIRRQLKKDLKDAEWLKDTGDRLVGLGGAVRNLAHAAQRMDGLGDAGIQGYVLTKDQLGDLVDRLAALPASERGGMPGIKPTRGEIILASALILQTVLRLGEFEGIEATRAGLREGVFFGRRLFGHAEPLFENVRQASVRNLAVLYESDMKHVEHVASLSLQMHDSLVGEEVFKPTEDERELLWAASMLHDAGMSIDYSDHHKHSHYLILTNELPGFTPRELGLIAQIARYHRKGMPSLEEAEPFALPGDRDMVRRCAMLIRLAEHLERGRDQSVKEVRFDSDRKQMVLSIRTRGDATVARWSVERYGDDDAFHRVFNRRLVIG